MGFVPQPKLNSHRSTDPVLSSPIFSSLEVADSIPSILWYVHFAESHVTAQTTIRCTKSSLSSIGILHYATPTSKRPVGIPDENGLALSNKTGPTNRNDLPFFIPFLNVLHK